MKQIKRFTTTSIAAVTCVALLNACSITPYVRNDGMVNSLPIPPADTKLRFAGDLETAIAHVDAQRLNYYQRLNVKTIERNLLSSGLIALSAVALYKGIRVPVGGNTNTVTKLGIAAGATYAMGNYSNSPNTELAYLHAANELTCLVLRTRPWLLQQDEFTTFKTAIETLTKKVNKFDALYQRQVEQADHKQDFLKDTGFYRRMLYNARQTLRKGHNFKGYVDTAGFQLRQEAVLVMNSANLEIHRLQPELASPAQVIAALRSTSEAFKAIKPLDVAAPDSQDGAGEGNDGGAQETSAAPAAPPAAPASAPAIVASAAAPAASSPKPPASAPTTAASAPETSAALGKEIEKLNARIEQIKAAQEKAAAMAKKQKKATDASKAANKKLSEELAQLTLLVKTLQAGKAQTDAAMLAARKASLKKGEALADALTDVFAAMRPVNAVLTRAYSLKPYVKNIPECTVLNVQPFEFTHDADEVKLTAGQSFEVAVTGGTGVPRLWMAGAMGGADKEMPKFTTSIDGGLAKGKLELPASTPAHTIFIMAVDGSGKQKDQIKIVVEAAAKAKAK